MKYLKNKTKKLEVSTDRSGFTVERGLYLMEFRGLNLDRNLRLLDVLIGQDEVVVHEVVVEGVVVYVAFRHSLPIDRVLVSARVVQAACTRHHMHTIRLVLLARPRAEAARSRGWTRGQGIGLDSTRRWVRISVWTMTVFSFSSALEWWT